jgi:hypothetical protein
MANLYSNYLPHQPQNFPGLGMTMDLQLRIGQLPIHSHFKLAAIRWHQHQRFDQMLIMLEQFLCQAHGPAGVVSDRAVNDLDFQHGPSTIFDGLYHLLTRQFLQERGNRLIGRPGFDLPP